MVEFFFVVYFSADVQKKIYFQTLTPVKLKSCNNQDFRLREQATIILYLCLWVVPNKEIKYVLDLMSVLH